MDTDNIARAIYKGLDRKCKNLRGTVLYNMKTEIFSIIDPLLDFHAREIFAIIGLLNGQSIVVKSSKDFEMIFYNQVYEYVELNKDLLKHFQKLAFQLY